MCRWRYVKSDWGYFIINRQKDGKTYFRHDYDCCFLGTWTRSWLMLCQCNEMKLWLLLACWWPVYVVATRELSCQVLVCLVAGLVCQLLPKASMNRFSDHVTGSKWKFLFLFLYGKSSQVQVHLESNCVSVSESTGWDYPVQSDSRNFLFIIGSLFFTNLYLSFYFNDFDPIYV